MDSNTTQRAYTLRLKGADRYARHPGTPREVRCQ